MGNKSVFNIKKLTATVLELVIVMCIVACSGNSGNADQIGILFQHSATVFDDDLAILAGELSQAANNASDDDIVNMLKSHGMDHCESFNYGTNALGIKNSAALTIAEKRVEVPGQDSRLIIIVTRGTTSAAELVGDVLKGGEQDFLGTRIWNNVYDYERTVMNCLDDYSNRHGIRDGSEPLVFMVCGHSLGGACANAVGAYITHESKSSSSEWWSGRTSQEEVFVYTFGGIKVVTNDQNISSGYENIHNVYNEFDSYGPKGNWCEHNVSLPDAKFGHTELFSYDRGEEGWLIWDRTSNNHDIGLYIDAIRDHRDNNSKQYGLSTCSDSGKYDSVTDAQHGQGEGDQTQASPKEDEGKESQEDVKSDGAFTIIGSWRSVGSVGFGQAQPGATVTFTEDRCNFYSPSDTYRLYESGGALKLDCTNILWKDTLTFTVKVLDADHITIDTGSAKTTTELERITSEADSGSGGAATHIDGMYANFDLPLILVYDFYDDGVMYARWADGDGNFLSKTKGTYDIYNDTMTMYVDLDAAAKSVGLDPGVALGSMTGQSVTCELDGDTLYLDGVAFYLVDEV